MSEPETAILNRQVATLVEDNTRLNEHVRSLQRTVTRKAAEARAAEVRADAAERSMRDMRRELDRVAERLRQPEKAQP